MKLPAPVRATQYMARAILAAQLVLGILFWTGHADQLVIVHIAVGLLLVAILWVAVRLGAQRGAPAPLAAMALAWSVLMPVLGLTQTRLLPGSAHVLIEVLHLLVGLVAVGLVEGLARAPMRTAVAGS